MLGIRNLTETPETKHCQAGVGHECDQVWGDNSGEDGAGDELDTPLSVCDTAAMLGTIPYLGLGAVRPLAAWEAGKSSRELFEEE